MACCRVKLTYNVERFEQFIKEEEPARFRGCQSGVSKDALLVSNLPEKLLFREN
jgi:hypothetical protein